MQHLFAGEKPELILFDLDGTLVDSVPDLAQAVDRMLQAIDLPVAGIEAVRDWVGNGAAMLVRRALAGAMRPQEDDSRFEQAYQLFLQYYAEATADRSELYSGVEQTLQDLNASGVRMGVVTNKPIQFTDSMLSGFALAEYFDVVLGGDSLPQKKPSPEPLLHAMQLCGVSPEQTLMVGDSKTDVAAARAAGCPVVCVPYGYNHGEKIEEAKPDLVIECLTELV